MKKAILLIILICCLTGCSWMQTRMLEGVEETVTVYTYHVEDEINLGADDLFEQLESWELLTRIIPYIKFDTSGDARIHGTGDYIDGRANILGVNFPVRLVIVEWEPGRILRVAIAEGVRGSAKLTLEPVGNRTRLAISLHVFLLPNTILAGAFNATMDQDALVKGLSEEALTATFIKLKGELEGIPSTQVDRNITSSYRVFVDAYLSADETISMPPKELFDNHFNVETMSKLWPNGRMEAAPDAPSTFHEVGARYVASTTLTPGIETQYDMFVTQSDHAKETRFFILNEDVSIEWDFLFSPTASGGTKVLTIVIIDMPDDTSGKMLDFIIFISSVDVMLDDALSKLKIMLEETNR